MSRMQQIQVEHVPIDDLRPDPANPRRIDDQELEALTRSIREFGLVDPIIARREDKTVIGGHQRLLAARRLGYRYRAGRVRGPLRGTGSAAQPGPEQDLRLFRRGTPGQAVGQLSEAPTWTSRSRFRRGRAQEAAEIAGCQGEAGADGDLRPG